MQEQTIYVSDDGRRFDTAGECQEWEEILPILRRLRKKLWDAQANLMRTEMKFGDDYIQKQIGIECTDDTVIASTSLGDPRNELCAEFGDLKKVETETAKRYLDNLRRKHELVFGD